HIYYVKLSNIPIVLTLFRAFNIASTAVNTLVMHWVLIKHYGNLGSLASPESIYYQSGDTLARSIVMFIVHIFFISRVYILNRVHRALPYFMLLCAILVLESNKYAIAFNLAVTIYMFMNPNLASLTSSTFEMFMIVRCTFAALVDITVTAALLWSFRTSKTGFKRQVRHHWSGVIVFVHLATRTDTLLRRLLKYTVTRGVLVTVMQISLFAIYIAKKDTLDWTPVAYIEAEIYIMTMLVMLNSRPPHEKGGVVNVSAELASGRIDSDTSGSGEVEGESAYTLSHFPKSSVGHDKGIIITRQQMVTSDADV
ncbi:hypothetical protein VNI00_003521, partial [Paramarasmius palmivorus]